MKPELPIIGIEPWTSSGPGWANAGLKVLLEGPNGQTIRRDVYQSDFISEAEWLAFQIALQIWPTLKQIAERAPRSIVEQIVR